MPTTITPVDELSEVELEKLYAQTNTKCSERAWSAHPVLPPLPIVPA